MKKTKDIALISPYHGGSHQAWAEGYREHSAHRIELITLPARYWKWRMHGGAVALASRFLKSRHAFHAILCTDMLDLTTFLALTRSKTADLRTVLYMHENQLTYPLPEDGATGPMRRQKGERDMHYCFVNFSSMLAADTIAFNSEFHLREVFSALPRYLRHFPDFRLLETVKGLRRKSLVLPVGLNVPSIEDSTTKTDPPLIVWNQRWEYDKNPSEFFEALQRAKDGGCRFRLALCGQHFGRTHAAFEEAQQNFSGEITHVGHAPRKQYLRILADASLIVSAAIHEFFGVGVLEAMAHGAYPILPNRLSYPELIPDQLHDRCLYDNALELDARLEWALTHREEARSIAKMTAAAAGRFHWNRVATRYDELFDSTR